MSVPGAVGRALYGDEAASARILTEPRLGAVLTHVRRTESTPPGWYLVAWGARDAAAGAAFGDVTGLRLLSVLFAAGAAALTAVWALRLLGDALSAAVAGSLLALGSVPVEYAEQLRAYALVVLLSAAFGLLLGRRRGRVVIARFRRPNPRRRRGHLPARAEGCPAAPEVQLRVAAYSSATRFGTQNDHASSTSSRISSASIAVRSTCTQWYRRSDCLGSENFSGSHSTSASRNSFGKAKPIAEPSRDSER